MLDPRSKARRGLVVGLLLGLLAFVGLTVYADGRALAAALAAYDFRWFALGTALATANYGLRFLRWQGYLARIGAVVPLASSARIFFAGFSMGVSPGKLGEVLKSVLLAEAHGVPVARSMPVVLAERLTDLVALVLLVGVSSSVMPDGVFITVVSGGIVAALLVLCAFPPVGRLAIDLVARTGPGAKLEPKLRDAHGAIVAMLSPGPLAVATLLAVVAWALECGSLYAIVRGFEGASLGALESTFAYSGPTLVGALAMVPGGLLVTEGSMTTAIVTLGAPAATASVAAGTTFLVRLATLWWAVLLGVIAAFAHERAMAEVRDRTVETVDS